MIARYARRMDWDGVVCCACDVQTVKNKSTAGIEGGIFKSG